MLLSVIQRQGIVSLLPKKDKNQKRFNNDQNGFLKGRSIAENILLIDGIINFADNTSKPGLLMFVDFEKASIRSSELL